MPQELPAVPLTIEGSSLLHQMFRIRWKDWRALDCSTRRSIAQEFADAIVPMQHSAIFSLLGHKGDLMIVHFRNSFVELDAAQLAITKLRLNDYLEGTASYVSVVELGLYESTVKTYKSLLEKGVDPGTPEWKSEIEEVLARQSEAMHARLYPTIPDAKYVCFYPMNRLRGESRNWYMLPLEERQRQMHEHGMIGRRYAGEVKQIISGSIGFDDWEWGVDLFAEEPLVFKRLIYEMRFDEVSAVYAQFGTFYFGIRVQSADLAQMLA